MTKKKVEFEIVKEHPRGTKCDLHPESSYLLIDDGYKWMWCLECLRKMLMESNTGQWNAERIYKKES